MKDLLQNTVLIYGMLAWLVAQISKILIRYIRHRSIDLHMLLSAGGMPSSHSALVCATAMAVALSEGLDSPLFALAVALAAVVMYDATGVRRAAGRQATVLNQIVEELFQGHPISEAKLEELLGHTPTQVIFGAVLGILIAWIGMSFVWNGS